MRIDDRFPGLRMECDYDRVTLVIGGTTHIILKPARVPLSEWISFWGGQSKLPINTRSNHRFTYKDAEENNQRRLKNING